MQQAANRLLEVEARINRAVSLAGRRREEVTLIAVSKTKPISMLREVYEAGARAFGENKVQELKDKIPQMPEDVKWHLIGHLQRNKVKYIAESVSMIHSLDSLRLAKAIDEEGGKISRVIPVLVQVNVAGEESKFGLAPSELADFLAEIKAYPHLDIRGLMTVAPYVEDAEENRPVFRALRQLSVDINRKNIDNVSVRELSMGMTSDFEVAIEEGATMVRVGTAIFGERDYAQSGNL